MKIDLTDFKATLIESPLYRLHGMSCQGCATQVENQLNQLKEVELAKADKDSDTLQLTLLESLSLDSINSALQSLDKKYSVSEIEIKQVKGSIPEQGKQSWFATYQPILLIFTFLLIITTTIQYQTATFQTSTWMRHFMAGFFLVFSFFKFLNLKGFALSYSMYDIIAQRWFSWGYVYAIIEFGLGIAYLVNFNPLVTNSIALIIMIVSSVGVIRSVLNRQQIQCACLGDVFNLPMSTVTIIENGLMILMSGWMLIQSL